MTTQLYLIRHGQAYCNVPPYGAVAGMQGDEGLTSRGRLQAERLRDRLLASREIPADVLIASTLPRARQTAEIIQPAFGLPIIWDDEVQEQRPGEADGQLWEEVKHRAPDLRKEPFRALAPGAETWAQFVLRAGAALDRITGEHAGKTAVVVCHGGVIDASLVLFFGLPSLVPPWARVHTRNTSITHWQREEGEHGNTAWRLLGYDDDLHTRDIDMPERLSWVPLRSRVNRDHDAGDEPAMPLPTEEPVYPADAE